MTSRPPGPHPTTLPALRVELLGGLRVTVGGRPSAPPASPGARLLLAHLTMHPEQTHAREVLGAKTRGRGPA
ncbi:hypothetical protein [Deinococcus planocerae]|uniref:hypothetical protein n=1 Tax=Deinococcus planocerae TaxID=1737569 RepID=UPI000C7F0827|nr:hypothetical protein [Deinococcus planocerae]